MRAWLWLAMAGCALADEPGAAGMISSDRLSARVADGVEETTLRWSEPGAEGGTTGTLRFEWLGEGRPLPASGEPADGRLVSRWRVGSATITRTILADPESGAIFIHLRADMPGALGFRVALEPADGGGVVREDRRQLVCRDGKREARVWVLPLESDVEDGDGGIRVRGEGEALVILDAGEGPRGITFGKLAETHDQGRTPPDPGKIWRGVSGGDR